MAEDRGAISREAYASKVREAENTVLTHQDHHPHGGYTPAAFRHYVRQRALFGALDELHFRTVLDVGCAEGYFIDAIRDRYGAEVWGVDLSTTALAKAHSHYGLPVAAAEGTKLPFADGAFDLVLSTEVIEHVLDPDLMIAEMRRVSSGTVLVTTPISQSADEHEPDYALQKEGHVNNFDPQTVRGLFGPDADYGSFRCNGTLALIVGVGRYLPPGLRDAFYGLDHAVSQRLGSPSHGFKPLRNRDWLITVAGTGRAQGEGKPEWRCPKCRAALVDRDGGLSCSGCGSHYPVDAGVPDFFGAETAGA